MRVETPCVMDGALLPRHVQTRRGTVGRIVRKLLFRERGCYPAGLRGAQRRGGFDVVQGTSASPRGAVCRAFDYALKTDSPRG